MNLYIFFRCIMSIIFYRVCLVCCSTLNSDENHITNPICWMRTIQILQSMIFLNEHFVQHNDYSIIATEIKLNYNFEIDTVQRQHERQREETKPIMKELRKKIPHSIDLHFIYCKHTTRDRSCDKCYSKFLSLLLFDSNVVNPLLPTSICIGGVIVSSQVEVLNYIFVMKFFISISNCLVFFPFFHFDRMIHWVLWGCWQWNSISFFFPLFALLRHFVWKPSDNLTLSDSKKKTWNEKFFSLIRIWWHEKKISHFLETILIISRVFRVRRV